MRGSADAALGVLRTALERTERERDALGEALASCQRERCEASAAAEAAGAERARAEAALGEARCALEGAGVRYGVALEAAGRVASAARAAEVASAREEGAAAVCAAKEDAAAARRRAMALEAELRALREEAEGARERCVQRRPPFCYPLRHFFDYSAAPFCRPRTGSRGRSRHTPTAHTPGSTPA